ncbi:MAG TPA: L-seryl-tRNA(Sec) selenium transferase [Candidatus Udaeobacter sp.]|nr:L-seryl-tRNA(Sec) selenium transferase [Candidatus Udaeobacter sp.]
MTAPKKILRTLPSIEVLLGEPALADALSRLPRSLVVEAAREAVAEERDRLKGSRAVPRTIDDLARRAAAGAESSARPQLRRVLNATGVVLHTNLGRAPLPISARRAVAEIARGYSSLELDLETGRRGDRGLGIERWLTRLTGAEAALAVNNGAAAVLLTLSALAEGRSVIVSRGELVEIGGSFRIPDVMQKSGARLLEIGTTNRTHLRDYERAIEKNEVAAILRVHRSNFRIEGFTTRPEARDLAALARRKRVPFIEDLGSGALVDLEPFGLAHEPTVRECLSAGADVVTFSGDKLLGGSQAGLIVGGSRWLKEIRRDPLARALRLDKLALAALEATLALYAEPERAALELPTLAMLRTTLEGLETRARRLAAALSSRVPELQMRIQRGSGEVGGGALPLRELPGFVIEMRHPRLDANQLQDRARMAEPPVIGVLRAGSFRLDPRTLEDSEIDELATALSRVWAG